MSNKLNSILKISNIYVFEKRKFFIFNFSFLIALFLTSCFSSQNNTAYRQRDLSDIYNPGSTSIHPKYEIYHKNDSVTLLYVYLYTPELGFLNNPNSVYPQAKIKLNYKVMESFKNQAIVDTASKYFYVKKIGSQSSFVTHFELKKNDLDKYLLQIFIKDIYKGKSNLEYIYVDKENDFSSQNYLLTYQDDFNPIFNKHINTKTNFLIQFNKKIDNFYISRYEIDTSLSAPPFSTGSNITDFKKDTTIKVPYTTNFEFDYSQKGIYFIQANPKSETGKTVVNLGDDYPLIQSSTAMFEPLKYLTTSEEFSQMQNQPNKKIVVDNFWLNTSENIGTAKENIRIFYSRVFFANIYFTTYKEGWKTDRGMIYTVFGPPKSLYIGDNYEKWVYYSKSSTQFTFTFKRKKHKFTDNEYVLQRNVEFRKYWSEAVEQWRNGNIY